MAELSEYDRKLKEGGEKRREKFLTYLRGCEETGGVPLSVRASCDKVGITRTTVWGWRQDYPEFDAAYQEAMEDGTDVLEDEATRRAVKGVTQDVYHQGIVVGEKQVYSDDLMKFMLAGRRPGRYRSGTEVNVGIQNNQVGPVDDKQLARALSLLINEAKKTQALGG